MSPSERLPWHPANCFLCSGTHVSPLCITTIISFLFFACLPTESKNFLSHVCHWCFSAEGRAWYSVKSRGMDEWWGIEKKLRGLVIRTPFKKKILILQRGKEGEEREKKRERRRERERDSLVDSCMCPDWGLNQKPWCGGTMFYPTELPSQGHWDSFLNVTRGGGIWNHREVFLGPFWEVRAGIFQSWVRARVWSFVMSHPGPLSSRKTCKTGTLLSFFLFKYFYFGKIYIT